MKTMIPKPMKKQKRKVTPLHFSDTSEATYPEILISTKNQ